MKIHHVVYAPSFKSVDIHFWTKCTLGCRACYTRFETLDFGPFDDPRPGRGERIPPDSPANRRKSGNGRGGRRKIS